jgi:hypothetical protein
MWFKGLRIRLPLRDIFRSVKIKTEPEPIEVDLAELNPACDYIIVVNRDVLSHGMANQLGDGLHVREDRKSVV